MYRNFFLKIMIIFLIYIMYKKFNFFVKYIKNIQNKKYYFRTLQDISVDFHTYITMKNKINIQHI